MIMLMICLEEETAIAVEGEGLQSEERIDRNGEEAVFSSPRKDTASRQRCASLVVVLSLTHRTTHPTSADGAKLYWIKGPKVFGVYCWRQLKIGAEKETLGFLHRRNSVLSSTPFLSGEHVFDVMFPQQSSCEARILIIAATLFIDLLWFETSQLFKG